MAIVLKIISDEDVPYIWDAYHSSMKGYIQNIWGWNLEWQKKDFAKNVNAYSTFLIFSGSKRLGYIQLNSCDGEVYINMLVLEPEFRGQGFGQNVLSLIQHKYSEKDIILRCFKVNKRAHQFYLKYGFTEMEDEEFSSVMRLRKLS